MTDEQNPYNPENFLPNEVFYLADHEKKQLIEIAHKEPETGLMKYLDNFPEDWPDNRYDFVSQYSPKIKGYTVI